MTGKYAINSADFEGLGTRLRDLRHAKSMSLSALAASSGVPPSTISKIENGQLNPSLVHAINLATALDENLGFLINRDSRHELDFSVVRGGRRAQIVLPEMALTLQDLHGDFEQGNLEARLGVIGNAAHSGGEPMRHDGEELCYVLEGAIRYRVDDQTYDLTIGDSIHFKCSDPHSWENISQGVTRVLWVFSEQLSF